MKASSSRAGFNRSSVSVPVTSKLKRTADAGTQTNLYSTTRAGVPGPIPLPG